MYFVVLFCNVNQMSEMTSLRRGWRELIITTVLPSTAVFFHGTYLSYSAQQSALTYVHTTASFHLGKFGDHRYLLFVVEKKCSAEVRPNFGTRSACALKYSASAEHCKGMFGASLVCGRKQCARSN